MRARFSVLLLVGAWSLACSGGGSTPGPEPTPSPEPAPEPAPKPAPDADKCENYQGVTLPLSGGVITACTEAAVTIAHTKGDPKSLRWDYAEAYKKAGWSQADPVDNSPAVAKHPLTIVFENTDDSVILRCQGCAGGSPPGGGGPGGRPGRPGRPPR